MISRSDAIKNFLTNACSDSNRDLVKFYNLNMECQVNVAQDNGERIEGNYQGKSWHGWTDNIQTWKSFRIPYEAKNKPHYDDPPMNFDLSVHVEGIGMTGWNWKDLKSEWVGFDFDSLIAHKEGLTTEELENVLTKAREIPWVTIRRSTSGKGFHLYVFLAPVRTENHTEHAALARAILGKMSAITSFDFESTVDTMGGNIWCWHRKSKNTNGYELIKQGGILKEIPINWRDHIDVIKRKRNKIRAKLLDKPLDTFDQIAGQHPIVPLDEGHKKLIKYLEDNNLTNWWDVDHHMLVTHTFHLKQAHKALSLKGLFDTNSTGTSPQNAFCFPLSDSAWVVRRYSQGVAEHSFWDQDDSGWTRCFLNRDPDLHALARAYGGTEDTTGCYEFVGQGGKIVTDALRQLQIDPKIEEKFLGRATQLTEHKDGRVIIKIKIIESDPEELQGWIRKKGWWIKILSSKLPKYSDGIQLEKTDSFIRHLVNEKQENAGWVLKTNEKWINEPMVHLQKTLEKMQFSKSDVVTIFGDAILRFWQLVNIPFQAEYPGDRRWNRGAAQLRVFPSGRDFEKLKYDSWLKILQHIGKGLDGPIKENAWCKENDIICGADYLKCWVACLFQKPLEPLPYLFIFGPQLAGKSILHEALDLLILNGVVRADNAIKSPSGFNQELANAVLAVLEETDLSVAGQLAYNRIKDLTTSRMIAIHGKGNTPYMIRNTLHFIHAANDAKACPIQKGDSRITMLYVEPLTEIIPKNVFLAQLEQEAPDFLQSILNLEIPKSKDRLALPVIVTEEKEKQEEINSTSLEFFCKEYCHFNPGNMIPFSEFYETFIDKIDALERNLWSKIKVGREIPSPYVKGRSPKNCQHYIGNMSWQMPTPSELARNKLTLKEGKLV